MVSSAMKMIDFTMTHVHHLPFSSSCPLMMFHPNKIGMEEKKLGLAIFHIKSFNWGTLCLLFRFSP